MSPRQETRPAVDREPLAKARAPRDLPAIGSRGSGASASRSGNVALLAVGTAIAGGAWYMLAHLDQEPGPARDLVRIVPAPAPQIARPTPPASGPAASPSAPAQVDGPGAETKVPTAIEVGSEERGNYM